MPVLFRGASPSTQALEEIVQSYTVSADGDVNAGDLCEFINGQVRKTKYETFDAVNNVLNATTSMNIDSIMLNENFILCYYQHNSDSIPRIMLIKVLNGVVTIEINTTVVNASAVGSMHALRISDSKVLFTYRLSADSYLYGLIININYDTKVFNITTTQKLTTVVGIYSKCIQINAGRILMLYAGTANNYLYGVVLTIANDVISAGTHSALNSTQNSYVICAQNLSNDKILLFWEYYSSQYRIMQAFIYVSEENVVFYNQISEYPESSNLFYSSAISGRTHGKLILISENHEYRKFLFSLRDTNSPYYTRVWGVYVYGNTNVLLTTAVTATIGEGAVDFIKDNDNSAYLIAYSSTTLKYLKVTFNDVAKSISFGQSNLLINVSASNFNTFLLKNKKAIVVGMAVNNVFAFSVDLSEGVLSTKFVLNHLKPKLICVKGANSGQLAQFKLSNIVNNLSGLSPELDYYCDNSGALTDLITDYYIGKALSASDLLIQDPYYKKGGAEWI